MFHIGIIGGRLQGLEAAYLSRAAGYRVTLFDRRPDPPAAGLSDAFHCMDVTGPPEAVAERLKGIDALLPAVEDDAVLAAVLRLGDRAGIPVLHDPPSYAVSSSKRKSNAFFLENGIPVSPQYPDCPFPVIVKPSGASGSHGVRIVADRETLEKALSGLSAEYGEMVVEAFQQGPSLSLEVIGNGRDAAAYVATELAFDDRFDCKRVYAPHRLAASLNAPFAELCERIGRTLGINGLMDVEVIVEEDAARFSVLEIDARFPSQTPIAVYHGTGVNLIEEWVNVRVRGRAPKRPEIRPGCAVLEHVAVDGDRMEIIGETRLMPCGPLAVLNGDAFFGADAAITDYEPGKQAFKATLITTGKDWFQTRTKRSRVLDRLKDEMGTRNFFDSDPPAPSGLQSE